MAGLLRKAANEIARTRRVVVLTGAGFSKESGIDTFRDAQGMWTKHDPMKLASQAGFHEDPALVWGWYMQRRRTANSASPNPGHHALVQLSDLLNGQVDIVTQNVDDLHERAGSKDVVHLHGELNRTICAKFCLGKTFSLREVVQSGGVVKPDADGHVTAYRGVADGELPPRCPNCAKAYLRPGVVWFGESLPSKAIDKATELVMRTPSVVIVAGTSGVVYPAAALPGMGATAGNTVIDVNPEEPDYHECVSISLRGRSGEVLPALVDMVKQRL